MKLELTPAARADRTTILDYLAERSPTSARHVLQAIEEAFALIAEHPEIGAVTRTPRVRSVTLPRYPYRVFYRTFPSGISVLHIRHTSRRPWKG